MSVRLLQENATDLEDDDYAYIDYPEIINHIDFFNSVLFAARITGVVKDYVIGSCVVCAQLFFIFLFCKHRNFRTRKNVFVLIEFCIGISHFIKSIFSRLYMVLEFHIEYICVEVECEHLGYLFYFIFAVFLALDGILMSANSSCFRFYNSIFVYLIVSVNLVFLVAIIFKWTICILNPIAWLYDDLYNLRIRGYSICAVLLVLINVMGYKMELSQNHSNAIFLSNIFIFAYFPVYVHHILIHYLKVHQYLRQILLLSQLIPEIIAHAHPLLVFWLTLKHNNALKKFNIVVYFKKLVKRETEIDDGQGEVTISEGDEQHYSNGVDTYNINDKRALII